MKPFFLILPGFFTFFLTLSCHTLQSNPEKIPSTPVADGRVTLLPEEAQVLHYVNELRQHPQSFYIRYVRPYIQKHPEFPPYYTRSLRRELESSAPIPALRISSVMEKTAAYQANDLRRYQGRRLDHTSSNGMTFEDRMRRAGVGCAAENLYSADRTSALQMVLDLLIDYGVSSLGHRKNLLNPMYKSVGISLAHYYGGGTIMVQDFSCQ
ncbi:MAG: CAP domain-containing protein [Chitinophagaceae bacterium]